VVLAATALLLCACGGGTARPPAATPSPTAGPASPQALAAVRLAVAGTLSTAAGVSVALTGSTVFDRRSSGATATGSFDFNAMRGSMLLSPSGSKVAEPVVFTPTAVYIRPPSATELLPSGRSWIVDSFADTPALTASFPQFVAQVESVNPGLVVSELAWGITAAADAGQDTVGGRPAARYVATVDLGRAGTAATGPARDPYVQSIVTEAAVSPTMLVRVWVADGRLARIELRPPGTGLGATGITLSGFGRTVRADPPPPNQVVELAALTPTGERENRNGGDSDGG
jgi:hypothetical protein